MNIFPDTIAQSQWHITSGLNGAVAANDIYLNGSDNENLWNPGMAALDASDGEFMFWNEVAKETDES